MSKRLGKGIEALISSYSTEENDRYIDGAIALKNIIANKNQPRKEFDSNAMEDLINSIRENGILQPITVRPIKKGKYEIVADYEHNDFAKQALSKTNEELVSEREMVKEYL